MEAAGGRAVLDGARMAGVLEQAPWLPPCTQGAGAVHMALAMLPVQSCFLLQPQLVMEWETLQAGAVGKAVLRPQAVIQLVSMASDPGGDGSGTMP